MSIVPFPWCGFGFPIPDQLRIRVGIFRCRESRGFRGRLVPSEWWWCLCRTQGRGVGMVPCYSIQFRADQLCNYQRTAAWWEKGNRTHLAEVRNVLPRYRIPKNHHGPILRPVHIPPSSPILPHPPPTRQPDPVVTPQTSSTRGIPRPSVPICSPRRAWC